MSEERAVAGTAAWGRAASLTDQTKVAWETAEGVGFPRWASEPWARKTVGAEVVEPLPAGKVMVKAHGERVSREEPKSARVPDA